eukprot:scaffold6045_cov77-Skeletonema_marinoi.AAC.9
MSCRCACVDVLDSMSLLSNRHAVPKASVDRACEGAMSGCLDVQGQRRKAEAAAERKRHHLPHQPIIELGRENEFVTSCWM